VGVAAPSIRCAPGMDKGAMKQAGLAASWMATRPRAEGGHGGEGAGERRRATEGVEGVGLGWCWIWGCQYWLVAPG
jgi:hypothetical protein